MATKDEEVLHKPDWLKIKLNTSENYIGLKRMMRERDLNTVCEEAKCPNIHECWDARCTATSMVLGVVCTKARRFCAVKAGLPNEFDLNESEHVAESVELMSSRYVVIIVVVRDDLRDAGSNIYAETVREVRERSPFTTIEISSSDMSGDYDALETLTALRPDILNHNIGTARRLTPGVRARATHDRTLKFLRHSRELQSGIPTKSSIMVGLGETAEEIYETMDDLRADDVGILTIGQYLQPSRRYLKVQECYTPSEFDELRKVAMDKGLKHCQVGPLVRSFHHADEQANGAVKEKQRQGETQLNN